MSSAALGGNHVDLSPVPPLPSCQTVAGRSLLGACVLSPERSENRICHGVFREVTQDHLCKGWAQPRFPGGDARSHRKGIIPQHKCWLANKCYCLYLGECSKTFPEEGEWGHLRGRYLHLTFSADQPHFPPSSNCLLLQAPCAPPSKVLPCQDPGPPWFPSSQPQQIRSLWAPVLHSRKKDSAWKTWRSGIPPPASRLQWGSRKKEGKKDRLTSHQHEFEEFIFFTACVSLDTCRNLSESPALYC